MTSDDFMQFKRLLAVHLVLAVVPVATFLGPADVRFLPVMWALASISIAQWMLLSFWAGMGSGKLVWRLLGAMAGSAYIAAWPALSRLIAAQLSRTSASGLGRQYLNAFASGSALVLSFAIVFLIIRRWFARVRAMPEVAYPTSRPRYQFSILHVLVVTAAIAVVLALMRRARPAGDGMDSGWQYAAANALMILVFLVNMVSAAWAALSVGRIAGRVSLAILVALLLGIALAFAGRYDEIVWWLFPTTVLVFVVPTAIVVTSLLVVRSRGYRFMGKRFAEQSVDASGTDDSQIAGITAPH